MWWTHPTCCMGPGGNRAQQTVGIRQNIQDYWCEQRVFVANEDVAMRSWITRQSLC